MQEQREKWGDGILRFVCPACGYVFRYKRGKVKNPTIKEIDRWLTRARCCDCGFIINAKLRKQENRGTNKKDNKNNSEN